MKTHLSKIALAFIVIVGLSACGGGGGDSTPSTAVTPAAPVNTITVQIAPPSQAVLYTGRSFTLSATATSTLNLPLTYSWTVGNGSAAVTGSSINVKTTASGTYAVKVVATDSSGQSGQASASVQVVDAVLSTPAISVTGLKGFRVNQILNYVGSSSDPSGGTITYAWDFGDNVKDSGANTTHAYGSSGSYVVTLTATNDLGTTAKSTYVVNIDLPSAPVLTPTALTTTVNKVENFSASSVDPNGLALTYLWNFGDGITANTAATTHAYTAAGNYTATVTVTNSNNKSVTVKIIVGVLPLSSSNVLAPACAGANCGATSATTYSGGAGVVGVWSYNNTTNSPQNVNIAIFGVTSANSATLVFSNASASDAFTAPILSSAAASVQSKVVSNLNVLSLDQHLGEHNAHTEQLTKNQAVVKALLSRNSATKASANAASSSSGIAVPTMPNATPVVNDTRTWNDNFPTQPVAYNNVTVKQICSLASGRKAVFWVDPLAISSGNVSDSDVLALSATYCAKDGAGGVGTAGFDKLVSLLGDAYGPSAAKYSTQLINDNSGLQDINVVILNVPSDTKWGGYFYALNNELKKYEPKSNEALAFFVNAISIKNDLNYIKSTLLHESTHMINFYQRAIVRGVDHDTWLEETSAMMSEDIFANISLGGTDKMTAVRIPGYLKSGGGVNYIKWTDLATSSYAMGGSFGAFINRRYGVVLAKQLVTNCNDNINGTSSPTSYTCLDTLIKSLGGNGIADEFVKFGASIFGGMPGAGLPTGFGFPSASYVDNGTTYSFGAIDIGSLAKTFQPAVATSLSAGFTATTQTYLKDSITSGTYTKNSVVVPSGTSVTLVIH
ncbi:PKD domain-containing protein [Undibacterium sp. RTI2.1]|uniref:M30 family zinc metallopeptidase n=1 Tax=unclassified Undibacterium TaxID=2630295 RepID=UPI002AB52084|nr:MULTISPECIES: PKD domain-containing protein [unclassified Undibacterium]MDY7538334.1 PKD domain-containing protein [Undibacterium sp. 5I1]MEB0031544.1 PKD domain-containing protein [Undibacterium sp. RTI2.1]MEB0115042.1 PKD domain-containing protein [Undibacterium sp. RTI2.2]MEB0229391.1 PKD domain-containing protein [Undibacterium sp. 10I3]MEB0256001.1 PKD domain-containing protein [Undibacterium sp. 5I1]